MTGPFDDTPIEQKSLAELGVTGGSEKAIVLMCKQNEDDWEKARLGLVTASSAKAIVTPTGRKNEAKTSRDGRDSYMCRLAYQRLAKYRQDQPSSNAMDRGHKLEPEARGAYFLQTGRGPQNVGFVYRDADAQCGCSPDGMCPDRGLEVKCLMEVLTIRTLRDRVVPSDKIMQLQFSMWVTGLPMWDFYLYHPDPGIPNLLLTVEPDPKIQAALDEYVPEFISELTELTELIRGMHE